MWSDAELIAMQHLEEFLRQSGERDPVMTGVADVVFAPDRAAVLRAVDEHPDLLSDRGDAAFQLAEAMMGMMSPGTLETVVKRAHASVVAIREARS